MDFKLSNSKKESTLISTNRNLKNRWCVLTPEKLEKDIGGSWTWFNSVQERKNNKLERTRLYLGYDDVVLRPVTVKVVKYNLDDVATEQNVIKKRQVLSAQIELLNDILSPLLPEPLDWFNIENSVEGLPTNELCKTEPVLILDYQPGVTLEYQISKKIHRRFVKEGESREDADLNIERIARIIDYIRYFFEQIYNKGYMYVGLNIDEILLLKDDVPRFVGLGKICKVKDGKLDDTHINFNRTIIGYSAPEFKKLGPYYVERPDAKAVAAFNLGVILAQMMCEKTIFDRDVRDAHGYFIYPNDKYEKEIKKYKKGPLVHDLLVRLCDPNPNTRLKDFKEIEKILSIIKGETSRYSPKKIRVKEVKDNLGTVKFYHDTDGYGFIIDAYTGTEYKIRKEQLEKGGLSTLYKGEKVKFEKTVKYNDEEGTKKEYVNVVRRTNTRPVKPVNPPRGTQSETKPIDRRERDKTPKRGLWDKLLDMLIK